jgi:hypothetical protein
LIAVVVVGSWGQGEDGGGEDVREGRGDGMAVCAGLSPLPVGLLFELTLVVPSLRWAEEGWRCLSPGMGESHHHALVRDSRWVTSYDRWTPMGEVV